MWVHVVFKRPCGQHLATSETSQKFQSLADMILIPGVSLVGTIQGLGWKRYNP
jgi:hypothetical protein